MARHLSLGKKPSPPSPPLPASGSNRVLKSNSLLPGKGRLSNARGMTGGGVHVEVRVLRSKNDSKDIVPNVNRRKLSGIVYKDI